MQLALHTMRAIDDGIQADQGAAYRINLGKVIPHMGDAYRGADEGFRSHLGASMIGKACDRQIWYGFRWFRKPNFSGRMLRLFNRGHLEEARFIAMLIATGYQVYQQDAKGNQFRISDVGGHFGGSGDGVVIGIPDVPAGIPALLEFKTHGSKSFAKLVKSGVQTAKPEHYAQMQTYMRKMGLQYALYGAVCKDDDELHMEIIKLDERVADYYISRGRTIILRQDPPPPIQNASPGLFECRYCDYKEICHDHDEPARNCRTCVNAVAREDGTWWCESQDRQRAMMFATGSDAFAGETFQLTKERQLKGCQDFYIPFR